MENLLFLGVPILKHIRVFTDLFYLKDIRPHIFLLKDKVREGSKSLLPADEL